MGSSEFMNSQGVKAALVLHPKDNVAVVIADIGAGEECRIRNSDGSEYSLKALEDIEFGHKIALVEIGKDTPVIKYGEEIGRMGGPIAKGGWIHNHNMYCSRGM